MLKHCLPLCVYVVDFAKPVTYEHDMVESKVASTLKTTASYNMSSLVVSILCLGCILCTVVEEGGKFTGTN